MVDGADDEENPDAESRIVALDGDTVRRIAAGEVVERPASVVKELVENSLDADASRVTVAVEAGGTEGIRVRDDGEGMSERELELAVREHHTSKIGDISDLEAGVATLGFRGEALYAVGAISRLTVRSKPRNGDLGHELVVEGGDVGATRPAGCPEGTTIEVDDLFFNVPARKKFLKTVATEFDHVNTVVTQYALANPDVAVSLDHDGREVFATEGNGDLRSTVLSVYGREVAESMVDVAWQAGSADETGADGDADSPVYSVTGLVSHPETTRAGREYLSTFVNDRYVTDSTLREAVLDAYGGQLASDRYPFAVLFVEVDPATVDVNVHPRKLDVRFDDEVGVKGAIETAVEQSLLSHGLIRSSAPRGRSKADEATLTPGDGDDEVVGGAGTRHEAESGVRERRSERRAASETRKRSGLSGEEVDAGSVDSSAATPTETTDADADSEPTTVDDWSESAAEATDTAESEGGETDSATTADASTETVADEADWSVDLGGSDTDTPTSAPTDAPATEPDSARPGLGSADHAPARERPSPRAWQSDTDDDASEAATSPSPNADRSAARDPGRTFTAPTTQHTLGGDEADAGGEFDSLPAMRVLGQLHDTYVVAETHQGLVLVDQHAADERVNYERLRREFADGMAAQTLADPVSLELTAREAELFGRYDEALARLGFDAERTDDRTVTVRSVPAVFDATLDPALLRDALTAFVADESDGGQAAVDDVADELLADLACYPSVTGNTSLTEGSVADLLSALDACENPYACPHGRPVIIEFAESEIQDRFERDYPGHDGRRRED
jgi:DNA mismatch repair protein MutL